jgi:septal ring factor EnvC (AmiA/AmiB activator)
MSFRQPFLGGILEADNFSDLARKLKFGMVLAQSNKKLLDQTLQTSQTLGQQSAQWNENEQREKRISSALGHQETNYARERKNRTIFLTSLQRQKEARERMIGELSQAAQDLQDKVASLLQQAAENKRQQAAWVSAGQGLTVKRGKIPWPVSGKIIQPFGRYKNPEFKEVVDNSGIQIQAPQGTPFRAVEGGIVRYADWFKGYGKLVILDHGAGYYSLYAQAAELNVSEGEKVVAGEVLGAVGDTGSLVGTSLYFEIRKNGVPQDPALWLKHRY